MPPTSSFSSEFEVLVSIDATLKRLERLMTVQAHKSVATEADLQGKYGDPTLNLNVPKWTGDSFKGRHFSECPPDLLDMLASLLDWLADKEEAEGKMYKDKPTAPMTRKNAFLARGWAAKKRRDGWTPAATPTSGNAGWATAEDGPPDRTPSEDEIGF